MPTIFISSSNYYPAMDDAAAFWDVVATYSDATGTRTGPYRFDLPDTATQDDISAVIAACYSH